MEIARSRCVQGHLCEQHTAKGESRNRIWGRVAFSLPRVITAVFSESSDPEVSTWEQGIISKTRPVHSVCPGCDTLCESASGKKVLVLLSADKFNEFSYKKTFFHKNIPGSVFRWSSNGCFEFNSSDGIKHRKITRINQVTISMQENLTNSIHFSSKSRCTQLSKTPQCINFY